MTAKLISTTESMFDRLRSLPLLKGLSINQISGLVEKSHLEFKNYQPGEVIIRSGEKIDRLRFLLSGTCELRRCIPEHDLELREYIETPAVIGAVSLFGLENRCPMECVASTPAGVMELDKSQYISALSGNEIIMINYVNYLAMHAQKPWIALSSYPTGSLYDVVARWLVLFTGRSARKVVISYSLPELSRTTGIERKELYAQLLALARLEGVRIGEHEIEIGERAAFLDKRVPDAPTS